jgi:hypothetical protein
MGFFGRMLGIEDEADRARARVAPPRGAAGAAGAPDSDAQAIERYRYMLRTAPPETLEQANAEAFAKLTPEQRRTVLAELTAATPPAEQANVAATPVDDPNALARVATRTEIRQPGTLERALGSGAMGFGGGLLSSFAMGFVGSMVAQSFFSALGGMSFGGDGAAADAEGSEGEALAENDVEDNGDYADDGMDDGGDMGDFDV